MDNVIKLESKSTYSHIQAFLNDLSTKNTRIMYSKAIKTFIKWKYRDLKLEHIQPRHLNELTYLDMKNFRQYLRNKYAVSTVNSRMYGVYSLLKELKRIKIDDNYVYTYVVEDLQLKPLKNITAEEYGDVDWEEVSEWIDYIRNSDMRNKEMKAMFFHMARVTGLRKTGLLNLTYKDLKQTPEGIWQIHSSLKGKKHKVSIKDEDAQMLLQLQETRLKSEKIFKMSDKTVERLFDHIKKVFNIDPDRNIVLHSLRGLSGWEIYLASGKSMVATQQHLNHSSPQTTFNYIKKRESANQSTLYMKDKFSREDVEHLDNDQWVKVFEKLSRSAKYEILNKVKELGLLDK